MAGQAGTLEFLAQQVGLALQPLQTQLTPANIIPFLSQLGLQFPASLTSQSAFMGAVNAGSSAAAALPSTLSQLASDITNGNETGIVEDGIQLISEIGAIVSALQNIGTELSSISGSLSGMNAADVASFAATLADNLFSYLLISYLENQQPGVVGIANLLGIVSYVPNPGITGDPTHPPYISRQLQLANLGTLLSAPLTLFRTLYGWGNPNFDGTQLLPVLSTSLNLLGDGSQMGTGGPPASLTSTYLAIQANPVTSPPGLTATLSYTLPTSFDVTVPLTTLWSVQVQIAGSFAAGLQATLTPPTTVSLKPPTGTLTGQLQMNLVADATGPSNPIVIFGEPGSTALQATSFSFGGSVNVTWSSSSGTASAVPGIQVSTTGGQLIIDASEADGFLQSILPADGVNATVDLDFTWDAEHGIQFTGGAGLSVALPVHLSLGPIDIDTINVGLSIDSSQLTFPITVDGSGTLGPISAEVEGIGISLDVQFTSGNLGPVNLTVGFVPPTGLGLSIDAPAVSGGGFIAFDAAQAQYAGGLELTIEALDLKAFGILNTKPDVSFVIIISADFPPIQLGFGFFLAGVGGLIGVNRTMATDPLRAAFRAHTIDDIVFLHGDIVSQAPTLIQGVSAIFPPAPGQFVIGPFVTITWGDPALLTAELGFIISLPDPVSIAILGAITVGVPDPDLPLILLNLDVLGTWDSAAELIEIDASLYDSYVAAFAVGGDSAFRLAYGDDPSFALSVGGLNPQFQPPPKFPTLKRMSISLGSGGNPGLSVQGYFAVTSNSVQFGAAAQLIAEAGGFGVHGAVSFDVLFVLSPFGFVFDLHAELDILAGGSVIMSIHLDGLLSGTSPWHVHGDASFSILFFSISVNIDATFGQSGGKQNQPTAQVIPPLQAALQDARNWSAALPANAGQVATLAAVPPSSTAVIVHPLGEIEFRQTVVPLDLTISKFGNATPSDATLFAATGVSLNGATAALDAANTLTSEFADGQFFVLTDQEKISKPSYTPHDSGAVFTSGTILAPFSIETDVVYQTFVENDPIAGPIAGAPYRPYQSTVIALAGTGPSANSPRRQAGPQRYITPGLTSAIAVNGDFYTVVSATSFAVRSDIVTTPGNYYSVEQALNQHLASNPGETQSLQIVAVYETAQAA